MAKSAKSMKTYAYKSRQSTQATQSTSAKESTPAKQSRFIEHLNSSSESLRGKETGTEVERNPYSYGAVPKCEKCQRFMLETGICSFCNDPRNATAPSRVGASSLGFTVTPSRVPVPDGVATKGTKTPSPENISPLQRAPPLERGPPSPPISSMSSFRTDWVPSWMPRNPEPSHHDTHDAVPLVFPPKEAAKRKSSFAAKNPFSSKYQARAKEILPPARCPQCNRSITEASGGCTPCGYSGSSVRRLANMDISDAERGLSNQERQALANRPAWQRVKDNLRHNWRRLTFGSIILVIVIIAFAYLAQHLHS